MTDFLKTNIPCENKQLHYQLGDLEQSLGSRNGILGDNE